MLAPSFVKPPNLSNTQTTDIIYAVFLSPRAFSNHFIIYATYPYSRTHIPSIISSTYTLLCISVSNYTVQLHMMSHVVKVVVCVRIKSPFLRRLQFSSPEAVVLPRFHHFLQSIGCCLYGFHLIAPFRRVYTGPCRYTFTLVAY